MNLSSKTGTSYDALRTLVKIEWKLALREPIGLVFGAGLPILLLLIFGNVPAFTSKAQGASVSIFELYIPVLLILVLIMIGLLALPAPLARNREIGWLRRISTTPASPAQLLMAQVIINLFLAIVAIVIILVGSHFIFGVKAPIEMFGFILSVSLAIISLFSLGLLIGSIARTQGVATVLSNVLLYPFLFFSGVYIPVAFLPGYLQTISILTPVGAAVKALNSSMQGTFPSAISLLVMAAYAITLSILAARYFKWE